MLVTWCTFICDRNLESASRLKHSETEYFKVPSDVADPLHVPRPCRRHDLDDKDNPDTTTQPPPSLPDIPDAISASAQHLSNTPRCVTPPTPAFPADRIMDDTAAQPSCPEDPS